MQPLHLKEHMSEEGSAQKQVLGGTCTNGINFKHASYNCDTSALLTKDTCIHTAADYVQRVGPIGKRLHSAAHAAWKRKHAKLKKGHS